MSKPRPSAAVAVACAVVASFALPEWGSGEQKARRPLFAGPTTRARRLVHAADAASLAFAKVGALLNWQASAEPQALRNLLRAGGSLAPVYMRMCMYLPRK